MLIWFSNLKKQFEASQLNKDSLLIISQAQQVFGDDSLTTVSQLVDEEICKAHTQFGEEKIDLKRAIIECRRNHKEAIKSNDQKRLSAITLAIIFLRAQLVGELAGIAKNRIKTFIERPSFRE